MVLRTNYDLSVLTRPLSVIFGLCGCRRHSIQCAHHAVPLYGELWQIRTVHPRRAYVPVPSPIPAPTNPPPFRTTGTGGWAIIGSVSVPQIQAFYAARAFRLNNNNWFMLVAISLGILCQFGASVACAALHYSTPAIERKDVSAFSRPGLHARY